MAGRVVWHAGTVTTPAPDAPLDDIAQTPDDVRSLVPAWLSLPDVAERMGVSVTTVRRLVEERILIALRVGERGILSVPEPFLGPEGPLPALRGTFTVLADGGMDDAAMLRWLFTPDPTLPTGGTPVDAIRAGHKTEVRRRAMELAF